jgi:TPR repeat protein
MTGHSRRAVHGSAPAALLVSALIAATATGGGLGPAIAQSAALQDARVTRCLQMALRRENPKLPPTETVVERAAMMFEIPVVLDGFAACRLALAAFPAEPKVVIAEYNAAEMMRLLVFGVSDVPRTDAEAVARLRARSGQLDRKDRFLTPAIGMFLGSAYEFGIGTSADHAEAARWYGLAADAGSQVARRELDRMLAASGARK